MRAMLEKRKNGSSWVVLYYDSKDELEQERIKLRLNIRDIKREIEHKEEQLERCYVARKRLRKAKITERKENIS